jgi:hypothetical protein
VRALAACLAALALLLAAASAGAQVPPGTDPQLLDDADSAELAQTLAEAQTEQGICYGWDVDVDGYGRDVGSSAGPDVPLDPARCPKYAVLEAHLDYACDSCDSEDSGTSAIRSNLPNPPTGGDLARLGYDTGDLLGDKDDVALFDMAGALPLLAAERGNAPFVPYEVATRVPASDHATGSPSSDLLRESWIWLVLFGALLLGGPLWFFYKRGQQAMRTTTKE